MVLQRKTLVVAMAVMAGMLVSAAAQAQTAAQAPAATKPKVAASTPKTPPAAPAGQERTPAPSPGVGQGAGRGMGRGLGQGFGQGSGGMMGFPGARQFMMRRRMGRDWMPGAAPGDGLLQQLNLTQAQQDQLKAIREQQQKDRQALQEKTRDAREKLRAAMQADVPDEAAVKAAGGALATLQAEKSVLQARSMAQRMKVLTPEQQ